jgi:hypothetical protein
MLTAVKKIRNQRHHVIWSLSVEVCLCTAGPTIGRNLDLDSHPMGPTHPQFVRENEHFVYPKKLKKDNHFHKKQIKT